MAKKKPATREYRLIIHSDAVIKTTHVVQALSLEEAVRLAQDRQGDHEEMVEQTDRTIECDGKDYDVREFM